MHKYLKLLLCIGLCTGIGAVASYFTIAAIRNWYVFLNKPSWRPPNEWFGPVWTALYIMMGVALWLVWMRKTGEKRLAVLFFMLQLLLNAAWSFLFFSWHRIDLAFLDICLLWLMILCTIWTFRKLSVWAAWLLVPYIAWVSFAAVLNYAIWKMN